MLSEHLGNRKYQICRGNTLGQISFQLKAYNLRNIHRQGLPKHCRLSFDATHTPTENG